MPRKNIHIKYNYKYLRVYKKLKNYFGGHKKLTLSTEKSNLASLSESGFFHFSIYRAQTNGTVIIYT